MVAPTAQTASLDEALQQILQSLRPEVAEALRACAVPHWFDEAMIGALRGTPEFVDKILNRVTRFTFVEVVAPGRYALHDNIRARLLEQLRAEATLFGQYHARAMAEFDRRLAGQPVDETIQWERVYHQLAVEPDAGLHTVERLFEAAERGYRTAVCEVLIGFLREQLLAQWADYYSSRLALLQSRPEDATALVTPLLAEPSVTPDLRARIQVALGQSETRQGHWVRAIAHYEQALEHFSKSADMVQVTLTRLAIANTYADFAIHSRLQYFPPYRRSVRLNWLDKVVPTRTRAEWSFRIRYLLYCLIYLPMTLYLWPKSPLPSLWYLPRLKWSFMGESPLEQIPVIRLIGRALAWYKLVYVPPENGSESFEVRLRLAELLYHFNNSWAASKLLQALINDPASAALSEYRLALLKKDLARSDLVNGEIQSAIRLLMSCLETFRRYGDRKLEADTLALWGHAQVLNADVERALDNYHESAQLYLSIGAHLPLGWLLHEIEQFQRRRNLPHRQALREFVHNPGAADSEQLYFSRPARRFIWKYFFIYMFVAMFAVIILWMLLWATIMSALPASFFTGVIMLGLGLGSITIAGTWVGMTVLVASIWRAFPLERMEKQRPGFIQFSEAGLAWRSLEGRLEHFVPWADVTGAISHVYRYWREPLAAMSWLRLYLRDRGVFEINGYTTDFAYVVSEVQRRLDGSALWMNRDINYLTSLRSPLGLWAPFILIIGAVACLGSLLSMAGVNEYWPRPNGWAALLAAVSSVVTITFSWVGMNSVEDAAATKPERPIMMGMLLLGVLTMGGALLSFATGYFGYIASAILLANGLYWAVWAIWHLFRPRYLVPK